VGDNGKELGKCLIAIRKIRTRDREGGVCILFGMGGGVIKDGMNGRGDEVRGVVGFLSR
jgi:hypothetical protein